MRHNGVLVAVAFFLAPWMLYWRNILVMAASLRKFIAENNDRVTITVFANTTPPFTLAEFFKMLDVKVVDIPYTFQPPEGWYGFFGGSFYLLIVPTIFGILSSLIAYLEALSRKELRCINED